jgi:hypothetical protein
MPNTLMRAAASSRARNRGHIPKTTPRPALDGQADQRTCDQCGKLFMPRQHTGGSVQRFCRGGCRLAWHMERQRIERNGLYAGQPKVPATQQPASNETLPSEPAVGKLHPWETGAVDIVKCDRTEFVVALMDSETAGTRVETWPPEVRAFMDQHVSRWVEENKETRNVRAMTVAAPKYNGTQSCVLILHHSPKHDAARVDSSERRALHAALPGLRGVS